MAKQFSPNAIRPTDDWSVDPRNNLPYSGQTIQNYIKSGLAQSVGAAYFNQSNFTLYFFNNNEDRDTYAADNTRTDLIVSSTALNLSSDMYRVLVTNNLGSYDVQVATNQPTLELSLGFDVQTKTITDTSWTSTGAGANVKAYIDAGATGSYSLIPNSTQLLIAGSTYTIDVRNLLRTGTNRVKVTFESENDDTVTTSVVYSITLSEMYIEEFSNTWYNAIVEGENANYKLGGFKIVGALSKTLMIEIYQGSTKVLEFEKLIGISSYVDTPYIFTAAEGLDLHTLPTGVYICKAYLTSGSLTSIPVSYNFMYVRAEDKLVSQLVCVNNVAPKAYNYSTTALCDYAIYDRGFSVSSPHVLIQLWSGSTPTTKVDSTYTGTTTGEAHTLEYTIEWLIESTIDLNVYFNISLGSSTQVKAIPIDNSSVYPAEPGSDLYINATTRSNNDTNRTSIVNEATTPSSEIEATWVDMAWVDGIDGWTSDENGRKALLIPAGSKCTIPYQIFEGDNMTFEMNFKVSNVSDYSENIITVADDPTIPGFRGIRIKPTSVTVHSSADVDASNDIIRSKAFEDEAIVHLLLTIQNSFGGNNGRNLVTLYINGCKSLQFNYDNGVVWEHVGNMILGSSSADLYVYSCRVYKNKVLGVKQAEQNYINSLRTLADREAAYAWFNSVINENTHELLYEKVVNSDKNYNFFVLEMKDGLTVPSRANNWAKDTKGYSDLEMHFGAHPEWDFKLFNVETAGQGTTSMDYYRWNIRWRIDKSNDDKKIPVAYYNSPTIGLDGKKIFNIQEPSLAKTVYFDGGANNSVQKHPALMRITAKTNFASSMQSHKIGATLAYTALHDAIGLRNEAQEYADDNNLPRPTVAVYEYPAFGFARTVSQMGTESYEFIGLFTIGPDKGDKPTFGYNIDGSIKSNLITLEGTDHSRRMAKFQYPWNNEVEYLASNECINIVLGNNSFDNGWEVSNCHDLSTDKAAQQAAIQTALETEFKPAYDVAWNNSTLIFPISKSHSTYGASTAAGVLANINADIEHFRTLQYSSRFSHADMEFWIEDEYVLYHYDMITNQFEPGINLVTQNGTPTGENLLQENEWFKTKRRERFLAEAPNYWDIQDSAYHMAFCLAIGATDNFAKNSYPYKMSTLANGGRWKWRQDDLDTIFDTDNRGSDSKPYYIEFEDAENGSVVFAGSTSVFWNLLYEVFWNDYGVNKGIESIGKDVVYAMASLGGGSNTYSGIINFFKKYFWDNAQEYFPQSAYNVDAAWKYETAWLTNGQAVAPLTQSLGRHLEAEHLWCARRAIYIMSLFKAGAFAQYSDTSLGQITFRPQSLASITVTPVMWVYPALANGAGSPEATARTEEGQSYTFVGPFGTDGQTTFYIQASNYLSSVGDWKNLQLASQYVDNIDIVGAKLRTFKIGDEVASNVTTNVPSLSFNNTKCLEEIDARNASSLSGTLDLSACTRLKRAYLEGTNITQVTLPSGSKIRTLHLGDATNAILLKNLKFLTDLQLPEDTSDIMTLQIENCDREDTFDILGQLFNSNDSDLRYIRIIWDNVGLADADDLSMLAKIAANKKKDGTATSTPYRGINTQGNIEGNPVIEGTIQLTSGLYTNDLDPLGVTLTEDYPGGLKRALCSTFGTLYIIYDPTRIYINFADPEVEEICINNFSSDGFGVTISDAEAVANNDFNLTFNGNTDITSFDELQYFTGITQLVGSTSTSGAFANCTNLESITFPASLVDVRAYAFQSCASLSEITITGTSPIHFYSAAFNGGNNVSKVNIPNINVWLNSTFDSNGATPFISQNTATSRGLYINNVPVTSVVFPNGITKINPYVFYRNTELTSVTIPSEVTEIDNGAFHQCSNLSINGLNLPNCTRIGNGAFFETNLAGEINLPSLTVLGQSEPLAFARTAITKVTSLGNITSIYGNSASSAFFSCRALEEITLPNTLTRIGGYAFQQCYAISKVHITNIADYLNITFDNTTANPFGDSSATTRGLYIDNTLVENVVIPNTVTVIKSHAFSRNNTIKSVSIPNGITSVGTSFQNCSSLTSINLSGVTSIGQQAFEGCTSLTSINSNLSTLTTVGWRMFHSAPITGEINLASFSAVGNGGAYAFYGTNITKITIGGTYNSIPSDFCGNCTLLTQIILGSNITTIGASAFSGCTNVTSITLPTNNITLNNNVFNKLGQNTNGLTVINTGGITIIPQNCFLSSGLTSVTFLSATSLGYSSFRDCQLLTDITFGPNLTYIDTYVFHTTPLLTSVTIQATTPPTLAAANAFTTIVNPNLKIYVPAASVEAYKTAANWSSIANMIEAIQA